MIIREVDPAGVSVAVTFEVRESQVPAGAVSVVGDFNGWDPLADPLVGQGDGWRRAVVVMPPGRYRFRYLAESDHWFDDESADAYESNRYGGHDGVLVLDLTGIAESDAPADPVEQPAPDAETSDAETPAPARAHSKPPRATAKRPPAAKVEPEKATAAKSARKAKVVDDEAKASSKPARKAKDEPAEATVKPPRKAKETAPEAKTKPARRTKEKPADPTG